MLIKTLPGRETNPGMSAAKSSTKGCAMVVARGGGQMTGLSNWQQRQDLLIS
jgi:hypothetical protein